MPPLETLLTPLRKPMKKQIFSVFFFSALAFPVLAFDCIKATNFSEKEICQDKFLNALDRTLNENYRAMMATNIGKGAKRDLIDSQRIWLKERNKCKDKECINTLYKTRLTEICEYPVIDGIHAVCDGFEDVLESFVNQHNGD